ncbi:hypothetical protein ACFQVC_13705 [Streptomyces monticola]|uniref:Integral membrane protein n=1 Tax=Streptomyces monticola TaxID=2666263 RepID=A0ABW2JIL5_9ACTN
MVEAVAIAWLNWFLGVVVDNQKMSLAGLDPQAMSAGSWVAGAVFGLYLALCAVILLRTGVRDRAPGRFGRMVLISAAVVHGVTGALSVGLVGWAAFAFTMVVLGLIVLTLMAYEKKAGANGGADAARGSAPNGTPPAPAAEGPSPA